MNTTTGVQTDTGSGPFGSISLPLWIRSLQMVAYTVVFVLGIILTVSFVTLILCSKSLQQRGFAVTVQILLTNLAFSILIMPTSARTARLDDWTLGDSFCQFIAFANQWLQPQRWLLTAVLVVDRTLTISRPLKYEKYGKIFVAVFSTFAIIVSFLFGILPHIITPLQSCSGFTPGTNTCNILAAMPNCGVLILSYSVVVIVTGGVVPFSLYLWMFFKAKKVRTQIVPQRFRLPQENETRGGSSQPSMMQKQYFTIFLLFWTLLGCTIPSYSAFLLLYFSFLADWSKGYFAGLYTVLFFQPLFYGLTIADPITLMWHKDVKQEMTKIKQKVKNFLIAHVTSNDHVSFHA